MYTAYVHTFTNTYMQCWRYSWGSAFFFFFFELHKLHCFLGRTGCRDLRMTSKPAKAMIGRFCSWRTIRPSSPALVRQWCTRAPDWPWSSQTPRAPQNSIQMWMMPKLQRLWKTLWLVCVLCCLQPVAYTRTHGFLRKPAGRLGEVVFRERSDYRGCGGGAWRGGPKIHRRLVIRVPFLQFWEGHVPLGNFVTVRFDSPQVR